MIGVAGPMIIELGAIQAAAGSLKAAADLVGALIGLKVSAEVREKAIELQTQISSALSSAISAQTAQMELLERVRGLEGQLKTFNDWEAEKQRYRLQHFEPDTLVYALVEDAARPGEPPHTICPTCYERGRKSILQWTGELEMRVRKFACRAPECGAKFPMGEPTVPPLAMPITIVT